MSEPLPILVESSVQIAWDYLARSGQLGDAAYASRFLMKTVDTMVRKGERRKIMLSNRAIDVYRAHTRLEVVP